MSDAWILTTTDLAALGVGDKAVRQLLKEGTLIQLRRGFYRRPLPSDTQDFSHWPIGEPEHRHRFLIDATLPTLSTGTVFSHISAATLHGLPVPVGLLRRASVLRDGSGSGAISRTTHRRYAPLPVEHRTEIDGLPVTTLVRTAVDLGRTLPFPDAVAVMDAALAKGVERDALLDALGSRRPHNAKARAAIAFADPKAESPGESRCRATMKLAGVPIPTLQFVVTNTAGEHVARTDFAWEDHGVVGEFDGRVKYGRLLKPGLSVDDVITAEKAREGRIRECDWWIGRWITDDLRTIDEFRASVLATLALGHRRSA